jgi:hypothetical protein
MMETDPTQRDETPMPAATRVDDPPSRALLPFVLITFAVTWGIVGAWILFPARSTALFGEIGGGHPAFFLATWGPAIAALVLVAVHGGAVGLGRFLARLALWRCPPGWAAFVLLGIPLVFVAGAAIKGTLLDGPGPAAQPGALLAAMLLMLFLGPVEELGWRGVAQPLLQRHMAPLWAGLLIGATWGLWHLPAFHLAGAVQSGWNFTPFFLGNVALGVIVTPLLNATRGSLLWPALFHWQLINPLWPDAQPWDTWILIGVAVVVVWWNRATMLRREGAVTAVFGEER